MTAWIKGKAKHFIFWLLLIIYILSANSIYTAFFLKNGKPVATTANLPPESTSIVYKIDYFQPTRYRGEDLYELRGFAIDPAAADTGSPAIKIVLHSAHQNLVFKTDAIDYLGTSGDFMAKYNKKCSRCGFSLLLSKHVLNFENYQIYIVLEPTPGGSSRYVKTGRFIERETNALRFIGGK